MKIKFCLVTLLAAVLFAGCKSDDDKEAAETTPSEVITLNVDVVLPTAVQKQWKTSIDWALANLKKAQQYQKYEVRLNLRYHDEDTENLDALAYQLTHPEAGTDTCHAIIGPYHSDHAKDILRYAGRNRLPVIMHQL